MADFGSVITDAQESMEDFPEMASFDPTKRKKKKKATIKHLVNSGNSLHEKAGILPNYVRDQDEEQNEFDNRSIYPSNGNDQDYVYEELLRRVFSMLHENHPELSGDRRRTFLRPPEILQEGTTKTVFVNFKGLCKTMCREKEQVMSFILAEMGANGSLDQQQRLVVKGRFTSKNFEEILRRYINEYVLCKTCRSPDTIFSEENRLFYLRCEQCGSEISVAPIKASSLSHIELGNSRT